MNGALIQRGEASPRSLTEGTRASAWWEQCDSREWTRARHIGRRIRRRRVHEWLPFWVRGFDDRFLLELLGARSMRCLSSIVWVWIVDSLFGRRMRHRGIVCWIRIRLWKSLNKPSRLFFARSKSEGASVQFQCINCLARCRQCSIYFWIRNWWWWLGLIHDVICRG